MNYLIGIIILLLLAIVFGGVCLFSRISRVEELLELLNVRQDVLDDYQNTIDEYFSKRFLITRAIERDIINYMRKLTVFVANKVPEETPCKHGRKPPAEKTKRGK